MKILSIGDKIAYKLAGEPRKEALVEGIEICKAGNKYGRATNMCDLHKHKNGVVSLSDGHWCYFEQIRSIEKIN